MSALEVEHLGIDAARGRAQRHLTQGGELALREEILECTAACWGR